MTKVLSLAIFLGTGFLTTLNAIGTPVPAVAPEPVKKEVVAASSLTPAQQTEIEQLILKFIKANPEQLLQSLQDHTTKQQQAALKKVQDNINLNKEQLADSNNAIVIGNPNAPIKLVLFVDPNCPHCRTLEIALEEIKKDLPEKEKVAFLIRQWPILGQASEDIAIGLIAAYEQNREKFAALSGKLLRSEKSLDQANFLSLAKEAGFDMPQLAAGSKSEALLNKVRNTKELAGKIAIEAAPTIILVDKKEASLLQVANKDELKKVLLAAVKVP